MTIPLWLPNPIPTAAEERLLRRLTTTRKLFGFLRLQRHNIFDAPFQEQLAGMYRDTGAGAAPQPPAMMCLALLLQGYTGISDREAVELTVVDARWQLVLGCLGASEPAFSQGALQQFRQRLIDNRLDEVLLQRTVSIARQNKTFDWKKLPKTLRVAVDSRPLVGAGKVEDTFNLLGHAAKKIASCAADLTGISFEDVCRQAHAELLLAPSIKAGLDVDWCDPDEKAQALETLVTQVLVLVEWTARAMDGDGFSGPIVKYLNALHDVIEQNVDETSGYATLRQGVAADRRVSIEDPDMRHGRKSQSKLFNGFKEHVAIDLDSGAILACIVTPANVAEKEAAPQLKADIEAQGFRIGELSIDRGYLGSSIVDELEASGAEVLCKPWPTQNPKGLFTKRDFAIDMKSLRVTCPAGEVRRFTAGEVVIFGDVCGSCSLRSKCTTAKAGRCISIAPDEHRHQRLQREQRTSQGRQRLRERTAVEHKQAHLAARKGPRARYRGTRKNTFDLRRTAAVENLITAQRLHAA
jgi:hypothetical protein